MDSASPNHCLCSLPYSEPTSTPKLARQTPFEKLGSWIHEPTLFFSRENLGNRVSVLDYTTLSSVRILARRCPKPPYWPHWVWFHAHLIYSRLSISFWISHKGNLSMNCCWIGIFFRGRQGSTASYFTI